MTHVRILFIAVTVISFTGAAFANDAGVATNKSAPVERVTRSTRPNVISLALGDQGIYYSINYDRALSKWVGVGGGFSVLPFLYQFPVYCNFYPVGSQKTALLLTLGFTVGFESYPIDSFSGPFHTRATLDGAFGVGFEYRSRFLLRLKANVFFPFSGPSLAFGTQLFVSPVWPGLFLGYAF